MRRTLGITLVTSGLVAGLLLASPHALAQTGAAAPSGNLSGNPSGDPLQTCFGCHGPGGVSRIPTRPSIAGQKVDYVARQLAAFKRAASARTEDTDGDADDTSAPATPNRSDPIMAHMATALSAAEIPAIAAAVSKLACDGVSGEAKAKAAAKQPVMPQAGQGCVACHGADGIGTTAHTPNLAGQQRSYLRRQLLLIREAAWGAAPRENEGWRSHPIMERQAARITIEDVDALARYYAALDCRGAP